VIEDQIRRRLVDVAAEVVLVSDGRVAAQKAEERLLQQVVGAVASPVIR